MGVVRAQIYVLRFTQHTRATELDYEVSWGRIRDFPQEGHRPSRRCQLTRRSPLSVCVCVQSVKTTDFVGKTTFFLANTTDFLRRWRIFFIFSSSSPKILCLRQCLHCILMSEAPTLSMCGHTNEGIPSTEHVHMLHWACADIIMRGNPLTDMTDNTEDGNTNWQCLHTPNLRFC